MRTNNGPVFLSYLLRTKTAIHHKKYSGLSIQDNFHPTCSINLLVLNMDFGGGMSVYWGVDRQKFSNISLHLLAQLRRPHDVGTAPEQPPKLPGVVISGQIQHRCYCLSSRRRVETPSC